MISWIYWDPDPVIFTLPFLDWPILWYGVFFCFGFLLGFSVFVNILTRYFLSIPELANENLKDLRQRAVSFADRLTLYVVIGTIVGARLGHLIFYEYPSSYLKDPLEIVRLWEGGLASHGAVVGIILAIFFFAYRKKTSSSLHWVQILDFISPPAALVGACIRIGNFFNQEITGKLTQVPWAVVFGHPLDRTSPAPRHPVQLYEALGYFCLFIFFFRLTYSPYFLKGRGKLIGIFLIFVFSFRFFIEFLKPEQSRIISPEIFLTMGQVLSLPAILLGIFFYTQTISKFRI